jgi:hypothetical protein
MSGRHDRAVRVVPALLLAGFAIACGSETWSRYGDAGFPADGDDTEPDTETVQDTGSEAGVAVHCETALVPTCEIPIGEMPLIVAASDFGPGYRFVDVCSSALLAERLIDDGIEIAVFQRKTYKTEFGPPEDLWYGPRMLTASLTTPAGRARSIAGPIWSDEDEHLRYFVLICHPDGSCDVYAVNEYWESGCDGDHWIEYEYEPRHVFGPGAAVRGLAGIGEPGYEVQEITVVGNGAAVLGPYGMKGLVAPDSGSLLSDAAGCNVLVGDGGRVARSSGQGWVSEGIESHSESDLLTAVCQEHGVRIGGADGRLSSGLLENLAWDEVSMEPIVDLFGFFGGDLLIAINRSGCILTESTHWGEFAGIHETDGLCVAGVLPGPGLKSVYWYCWDPMNISFLTPEGLFGRVQCHHIS